MMAATQASSARISVTKPRISPSTASAPTSSSTKMSKPVSGSILPRGLLAGGHVVNKRGKVREGLGANALRRRPLLRRHQCPLETELGGFLEPERGAIGRAPCRASACQYV